MSPYHRTTRLLAVFATTALTLGIGAGAAHALTVHPRAATPEFQQPDLPVLPPIDVDPCVIVPQLCTPDTTVPDPSPTTVPPTTVPTSDTTMPTPPTTVPHNDTTHSGDPAPMPRAPHTVVTGSPHFTG
jgi:hypothetical protein